MCVYGHTVGNGLDSFCKVSMVGGRTRRGFGVGFRGGGGEEGGSRMAAACKAN